MLALITSCSLAAKIGVLLGAAASLANPAAAFGSAGWLMAIMTPTIWVFGAWPLLPAAERIASRLSSPSVLSVGSGMVAGSFPAVTALHAGGGDVFVSLAAWVGEATRTSGVEAIGAPICKVAIFLAALTWSAESRSAHSDESGIHSVVVMAVALASWLSSFVGSTASTVTLTHCPPADGWVAVQFLAIVSMGVAMLGAASTRSGSEPWQAGASADGKDCLVLCFLGSWRSMTIAAAVAATVIATRTASSGTDRPRRARSRRSCRPAMRAPIREGAPAAVRLLPRRHPETTSVPSVAESARCVVKSGVIPAKWATSSPGYDTG